MTDEQSEEVDNLWRRVNALEEEVAELCRKVEALEHRLKETQA